MKTGDDYITDAKITKKIGEDGRATVKPTTATPTKRGALLHPIGRGFNLKEPTKEKYKIVP